MCRKIYFVLFSFCLALTGYCQNLPKEYFKTNLNKPLVHQLENIFYKDQHYRQMLYEREKKFGANSEQVKNLWDTINKTDAENLIEVTTIIDKYGWLGADVIGEQGNSTLFLVIQHSDQAAQEKYLPLMEEAAKNGKANWADLALLEDRVAVAEGKKQIYGSQISQDPNTGKFTISPIEDETNVNKRRLSVGLGPIEEYVKEWGIVYKPGMSNLNVSGDTVSIKKTDVNNNAINAPKNNIITLLLVSVSIILLIIYFSVKKKKPLTKPAQ